MIFLDIDCVSDAFFCVCPLFLGETMAYMNNGGGGVTDVSLYNQGRRDITRLHTLLSHSLSRSYVLPSILLRLSYYIFYMYVCAYLSV